MKLETGLYFRTKDGIIGKIDGMSKDGSEIYFDTKPIFKGSDEFKSKWCYANDILNTNHNIKKLIEIGDIVKYNDEDCYGNHILIEDVDYNLLERLKNDPQCHLLEILTKEQFESNSYTR